jgi:HEAT repeat protein
MFATLLPVPKKEVSLKDALDLLRDDARPDVGWLRAFDDLDETKLRAVLPVWQALDDQRRVAVAETLEALMQNDVKLNFHALFHAFLSDANERVRVAAAHGLIESDDTKHIDPLVQLLQKDASPTVRAAAAETLGHFALLAETERISAARRQQIYVALLHAFRHADENSPVYGKALESLGYANDDTVAMYIRAALASADEAVRRSAVIAAGRSQNRAFAELVRAELHSVAPALRLEATRATGELEDEDAVKDLGQLIEDPNAAVREAALMALAQIGGDQARAYLQAAVLSPDETMAEQAGEALEIFDALHGQIDFSLTNFDAEVLKPRRVWQRKATPKNVDREN